MLLPFLSEIRSKEFQPSKHDTLNTRHMFGSVLACNRVQPPAFPSLGILAHLLRMVMEPKYLDKEVMENTPIIIWHSAYSAISDHFSQKVFVHFMLFSGP